MMNSKVKANQDIRIKKILDYINLHIKDANLIGLAAELGYTTVYTSVIVKKLLGKSFSKALIEARCIMAATLLRTTDMPIKQIIGFVGYENESFFRKAFNGIFSISPAKYRKQSLK